MLEMTFEYRFIENTYRIIQITINSPLRPSFVTYSMTKQTTRKYTQQQPSSTLFRNQLRFQLSWDIPKGCVAW